MPDSRPTREEIADRLKELRRTLLDLHKALMESERTEYERTFGRIKSANHLLQLMVTDSWFAWLHPLSQLVVEMDEALEEADKLSPKVLARFTNQARSLLKTSETGHGFESSYFEALQREPAVVLAHADVMRCLKKL